MAFLHPGHGVSGSSEEMEHSKGVQGLVRSVLYPCDSHVGQRVSNCSPGSRAESDELSAVYTMT